MELIDKLEILSDAAKYDASCASSGTEKRDSRGGRGMGSTSGGMGICHAYTPDGRCISLLKVLLTNFCQYECFYCVNRNSSDVPRARFTPEELVKLTLDFYQRNYIEGLFLSSGIIRSADYTMEQLIEVARQLREVHDFRGYIHLKTIPDASDDLVTRAGLYADRLSINVEFPTEQALAIMAPDKSAPGITNSMARIADRELEYKADIKTARKTRQRKPQRFAPAGQSTQMVIGAEPSSDSVILHRASTLYSNYKLRRVYYSAFSPIPDAPKGLVNQPAPLMREHRLYQADWLLRFYGYNADELLNTQQQSMLRLDVDPKMDWALRNRSFFPVDVNRAPRESLLRVPGFGVETVKRLVQTRQHRRLRLTDVKRIRRHIDNSLPFFACQDYHPGQKEASSEQLYQRFGAAHAQLSLFN